MLVSPRVETAKVAREPSILPQTLRSLLSLAPYFLA
jgi:hypothetical protein